MESSSQFAEIIFNLFFCLIIIVFTGFNVDYYNKIREKPSQAITTTESDSMFYVSIVILTLTVLVFTYFIYRIFTFREEEKNLFIQSQPRATLDRYNLASTNIRNPQFFNQSARNLGNINQSIQESPLYRQRQNIGGSGF